MTRAAALLLAALAASASGCALLTRGPTVDVRWYTPELSAATKPAAGVAEAQKGCAVRLGRVAAGSAIGLRIAHGDGLFEVGYYDGRRWTDRPEQYVRRAVSRALFEDAGCERAVGGLAPTLDVEVFEFQEVKAPTDHAALLAMRVVLANDRVLLDRTIRVSKPVTDDSFEAFVASMAQALDAGAREVGDDVARAARQAGREAESSTP